ncbi:MAG TPA: ABC transporter substrate-binding protein [Elusimicrobiales bacterium]|nr:ABC transporter substrate-binding protein [Elusimicrobiales bacterium]
MKFRRSAAISFVLPALLLFCGAPSVHSKNGGRERVWRVGILSGVDAFYPMADGFRTKMSEFGYVEGKNIIYDIRKTNADPHAEKQAVQSFLAKKVDLIYVFPTEPAVTAKELVDGKVPVVFSFAALEGVQLVQNLRSPGGNMSGVRYPAPELTAKRFELLMEFLPRLRRLCVFYDPTYPSSHISLDELRKAARAADVELSENKAVNMAELKRAIAQQEKNLFRPEAVLIMPEQLTQSPQGWAAISKFAERLRIPIAGSAAFEADSGALFSFIPDNLETGRLAADIAAKILRGVPAGSIAVSTPDSKLRINYRRARKLGIAVPPGLLSRADEIIR